MRFAVVIVSLNGRARIAMPLRALEACRPRPDEIIVVDNGSTDGLARHIATHFPSVTLVRASRNLGFAGGNNLGIINADADAVVLLNDDTEPEPEWLAHLQAAFAENPRLGIAGCQLLYPGGRRIQHMGGILHANGLTDHARWGEDSGDGATGPNLDPIPFDYVTGAAMAIRRPVFEEIGLLDDGFFPIYFEEVDFCFRARRVQWDVAVVPRARVIHHESQTTGRLSPRFLVTYHRNRLRFVLKNLSPEEWLRALREEMRWMIRHTPWDNLWPCAQAWAWIPFQLADLATHHAPRKR